MADLFVPPPGLSASPEIAPPPDPHAVALTTPVFVAPNSYANGVWRPGVAGKKCVTRKCTVHTYDWRARPGSPENTHRILPELRRATLAEVIDTVYSTEAHLGGYALVRAGETFATQPRITKDGLPWLRDEGFDVVLTTFMADVDNDPHEPWTDAQIATFDALWDSAPEPLRTVGLYFSPKGLRLLQPITRWLPAEEGEASQAAWHHALIRCGLTAKIREVKDWTRLMRTPHHKRASGPVRASRIDLTRMVPIDPPAGIVSPRSAARVTPRVRPGALPQFVADVPPGWEPVADALGAAIQACVRSDWRRCYLTLAGALCTRGCALEGIPAVIARAHAVDRTYATWEALLPDRVEIARTTVNRFAGGLGVAGYPELRAGFSAVADALDSATTSGAEARVLRQLAAPAPAPIPVAEAVAIIERALRTAWGVTLIAAPPGTGKTFAVAAFADTLPEIGARAAAGSRIAVSTPTHMLARQTASKARRSLRLFSPPSLTDASGAPVCIFADAARGLARGAQSVGKEFCEGRGKNPCDLAETCVARPGMEGDPRANLVTGVHGLARQLRAYAGPAGTLVIDEPPEILATETITLDDLDTARRYLDSFASRYVAKIAPALEAFDAWVRTLGEPDAPLTPLSDAVRAGVSSVDPDTLDAAEIGADGDSVLLAADCAIAADATSQAPPLTWRAVVQSRPNAARCIELGRASRVLHLLRRGLIAARPHAGRIDTRSGDRRALITGTHEEFAIALDHEGPRVVLDANAALHAPAIAKHLGYMPTVIDLAVCDGAPIERTILVSGSATRSTWLPRGVPDWEAIVPALRATVAWANEPCTIDGAPFVTHHLALIAPKVIRAAIAHALDPAATEPRTLWQDCRQTAPALDRAREILAPVLATFTGTITTGHYQALEGLDHMADCDATVTLMDPRPNLGQERDKAEYLGLDAEGRLDALAAAELQQAHGRLRTVHRVKPGRQLHVGSVVPAGWPGRPIEVRRMPVGRPRGGGGIMTGAEMLAAREEAAMGVREFARALGVSASTVIRYESGEREIPSDVARAVLALVPSVPETPIRIEAYRGVSGTPNVQVPATGGFGNTAPKIALQGVSGTPGPIKARRIDLDAAMKTRGRKS